MRPCMNLDGLGLDWAAALMPMRDPAVTTRIRTCLDYFVHAMVFSLDKEGRPVHPLCKLATTAWMHSWAWMQLATLEAMS